MSERAQAEQLLQAYYTELEESSHRLTLPQNLASVQAILAADPATRLTVVRCIVASSDQPGYAYNKSYYLLDLLSQSVLPYAADDIHAILRALALLPGVGYWPGQSLLNALELPLADPEMVVACQAELEHLLEVLHSWYQHLTTRKLQKQIQTILVRPKNLPVFIFKDEWGKQATRLLEEMPPKLQANWLSLLAHCATSSGPVPNSKWQSQVASLIEKMGQEDFCRLAEAWLDTFGRQRGNRLEEGNGDILRGLAWFCADSDCPSLAFSLAEAAIEGYRKIPGLGPRSPKIGAACVYALQCLPNLRGVAQLERVRLSVKQPAYLKIIEKALDKAALKAGMSRSDLEELTIPTFGLVEGKLRVPFGDIYAEIEVVGATHTLHWCDNSGKSYKTEPAAIKRNYKVERKALKVLTDDLFRMLNAQRERLERLPLTERRWSLADWQARYLDHPLVSHLARRLIWRFTDGDHVSDAIWSHGQLVDAHDQPLALTETTTVAPWHPIFCEAEAILAWRTWLEGNLIKQPFKQAHREVYLLTDAERNTHIYSNRFAAHILRQHQFHALAIGRGWKNELRLMVDDSYAPARLELPHWGLRAEFWIEGAGNTYGVDTNHSGSYLHLATDQVRFYPIEATGNRAHAGGGGYYSGTIQPATPTPLEQIPALVFSEVLRDVDLFIGVASVGNDPTWQDGGPGGLHRNYWQSYSFGELTATAETRKYLLAQLIPKLAIAERCSMEERFLKVRGDLCIYKIHLGSGNIMMEPNDQYLCIVPGQSPDDSNTNSMFLPFDGDRVFSIILSKAFLLANDTSITDPTITRQINRGQ